MRIPEVVGLIDRRILVNYRVDPAIAATLLPSPFRPQLVDGWAMAGICLIRLRNLRPWFLPAAIGLQSENAAHRIAVEWDEKDRVRRGVYIPRRDTSLRLNTWLGGRVFPGVHRLARFRVHESPNRWQVSVESRDGRASIAIDARLSVATPRDSLFHSIEDATTFFQCGGCGYSPAHAPNHFEGLELLTEKYQLEALQVASVSSSLFDDTALFPPGAAQFDSAFLMRAIPHRWAQLPDLHRQEPSCHTSPTRQRGGVDAAVS
jgi:hypothetical protein